MIQVWPTNSINSTPNASEPKRVREVFISLAHFRNGHCGKQNWNIIARLLFIKHVT